MKRFHCFWILALVAAGCSSAPPEPVEVEGVTFHGSDHISASEAHETILRDLERYRKTGSETALDDAVFRLRHHYQRKGYYFVTIGRSVDEGRVTFQIEEGPYVAPGLLHFRGNKALSKEELEEAMPSLPGFSVPFSRRLLEVQKRTVAAVYHSLGYIDFRIADVDLHYDEEDREMHVWYFIEEGPRYRLAGFEGAPESEEIRALLDRRLEEPYTPDTPAAVEADLLEHYRENGHPFVSVRAVPEIDRAAAAVLLRLEIVPGEAATFQHVRVNGNERCRKGFLRSRADIPKGEPYRASLLRRGERNLQNTGLFKSVVMHPAAMGKEGLIVDMEVEEADYGEVAVRGGYGTLDGVRVGGEAAYTNLLGGGEFIRGSGTWSRYNARASAETGVPFILRTNLQASMSAYYEEREYPSFDASSYGGFPGLSYPLLDRLRAKVGVRFADIETENVEPGVPPGDRLDFQYRAFHVSASFDARDDRMLPTRGLEVGGLFEWSGGPFDSDITFAKASGGARFFIPLPFECVLAASVRGGIIRPTQKTEEIPISLRYFAGGTNSVRGFEFATLGPKVADEPTGGEVFLSMQAELRFPIWLDFHGALFSDRGGVWFDHNEVDLDDTRYSVGGGLRYYTPAGAIVADVAWNPSRESGEDSAELHLSIGFPF